MLAFLDIGFGELLLCGVVALLLFGGRLPEAMGRFGAVYKNFRRGVDDLKRTMDAPIATRPAPRYKPSPATPLSQGLERGKAAPAKAPPPSSATPSATPPAAPAASAPAASDESPPV